ncbi:fumarylacetoacetate hydrolase family protein [Isoptericola variabilis]|uniref:fumarylacetoacetate hydrolase family protein n=1 Tax=Isoptericola variabilis TaxID=139208 RepID=UPI0009D91835|nr:fumarylacetoacetate hydrolase family protein [Isoptericola variabilis]
MRHVAGYTISNDVSERGSSTSRAGSGRRASARPRSTWWARYLVPVDRVDPRGLRIRSAVNGEARQDSSTADMIFDVPFLVWHISQFMALEPGDVINTGTPEGVALSGRFPYLRDGDEMSLSIDGLGEQRQAVRGAATAA